MLGEINLDQFYKNVQLIHNFFLSIDSTNIYIYIICVYVCKYHAVLSLSHMIWGIRASYTLMFNT